MTPPVSRGVSRIIRHGTRILVDLPGSFFQRRGPTRTQQIGLLVVLALLTAVAVARVIAG
jgi:hypothetical protein